MKCRIMKEKWLLDFLEIFAGAQFSSSEFLERERKKITRKNYCQQIVPEVVNVIGSNIVETGVPL